MPAAASAMTCRAHLSFRGIAEGPNKKRQIRLNPDDMSESRPQPRPGAAAPMPDLELDFVAVS